MNRSLLTRNRCDRGLDPGHPDLGGLCLALADWWVELRIVQDEKSRQAETRRRDKLEVEEAQDLTA